MTVNSTNDTVGSSCTNIGMSIVNTESITKEMNDNYLSMINVDNLTKEQLVSIINFINDIYKENLPVKCILLTLKTIIKSVECDMVEICQVVENNLVVNYMYSDSLILHKKVISYNDIRDNNLVYNSVYNNELDNIIYINNEETLLNYNNSSNVNVSNILLIPLFNIHKIIWGSILIYNIKFQPSVVLDKLVSVDVLQVVDKQDESVVLVDDDGQQQLQQLHLQEQQHSVVVDGQHSLVVNNNEHSVVVNEQQSSLVVNEQHSVLPDKQQSLNNNLCYLFELCYISGIIISNMNERIELEINKKKSNSLITLMHSLFSDQLNIQSIIISLTTHAKKLLQVEHCTIYIFDHMHNQLLSISSNKYVINNNININGNINNINNINEFINFNNDINNNILLYCLNTCNIIIFDSNYNNINCINYDININNIVIINEINENYNNIRNGIWIPIKNEFNKLLGILEVINKQEQELLNFTQDDLNLLLLFSIIITPQFEKFEFINLNNNISVELNNTNNDMNNNDNINNTTSSIDIINDNVTEAGLAFEYNINKNNLNNIKNFLDYSIKEEEIEEE